MPQQWKCSSCGWIGIKSQMEADAVSLGGDEVWSNCICPACKSWNDSDGDDPEDSDWIKVVKMKIDESQYKKHWTGSDSPLAVEAFMAGQLAAVEAISAWLSDQPATYEEAKSPIDWQEQLARILCEDGRPVIKEERSKPSNPAPD